MKKLFLDVGCILLAAMMLTNCNSEESSIDNNAPPDEDGNLSFVVPIGKRSSATYATVVGINSEYQIDNLFIYWFRQDGGEYKLHKVFKYGAGGGNTITLSNQLTAAQNSAMATVSVGDDHTPSRFYFITNVNLSGGTITSTDLAGLQIGASTAAFESAIANLTDNGETGNQRVLNPITAPLPMSINQSASTQLTNGYVSVTDPAAEGIVSADVHLKRRVARFDIINNKDYSNFEVTNVYVSRAQKSGYIRDLPFNGGLSWETGKLTIGASSANGVRGNNTDANNDGIPDDFQGAGHTRDSLELNPAIFYLWPTQLKANNVTNPTDGTEIMVEGIFNNNNTRLYKLNLIADQSIEANKIYRIRIGRVTENTLKFNLVVDHWDEADTISSIPAGDDIDWASCTFSSSHPNIVANSFSNLANNMENYGYCSPDTVTLTIVVDGKNLTADTKNTANIELSALTQAADGYINNVADDVKATVKQQNIQAKTVLTYAPSYKTTFIIKLPPTYATLVTKLVLSNPLKDSDRRTIFLGSSNYNKQGFRPANMGNNKHWAPVNVGATKVAITSEKYWEPLSMASDSVNGKFFQWGGYTGLYALGTRPIMQGPVTPEVAAANTDKFFSVSNAVPDWLTPSDDSLWSGVNAQGPCPKGWRVPTKNDYEELFQLVDNTVTLIRPQYNVKIENAVYADSLILPFTSSVPSTGQSAQAAKAFVYWTSTPNLVNQAYYMDCSVTKDKLEIKYKYRSQTGSIRCVHDMYITDMQPE